MPPPGPRSSRSCRSGRCVEQGVGDAHPEDSGSCDEGGAQGERRRRRGRAQLLGQVRRGTRVGEQQQLDPGGPAALLGDHDLGPGDPGVRPPPRHEVVDVQTQAAHLDDASRGGPAPASPAPGVPHGHGAISPASPVW